MTRRLRSSTLNRTQQITLSWLERSGLDDETLVLEALQRRGYLAFRDASGLALARGSCDADMSDVRGFGLASTPCAAGPAIVRLTLIAPAMAIARAAIALPEPHINGRGRSFSAFGPGNSLSSSWRNYRQMGWGARLAVRGNGIRTALDLGIALLVKALPLIRVATSYSCDGHGERPARIKLHYAWDAPWGAAVLRVLGYKPVSSRWSWEGGALEIAPVAYDDAAVLAMLDDIQRCARAFMDVDVVAAVGQARQATLDELGESPPAIEAFAEVAARQLARVRAALPGPR